MLIYIQKCLTCNLRNDFCVSDKDREVLTIKISRENDKNILLSCWYRPPNGSTKNLNGFLQNKILDKSVSENKNCYITGDFNINCLKYHENAKIKQFYDNIFRKGSIPIINRRTQMPEHSASLNDNILTTNIFNSYLKKDTIKSDVSDHFPMFFSIQVTKQKLSVIKIKKKSF